MLIMKMAPKERRGGKTGLHEKKYLIIALKAQIPNKNRGNQQEIKNGHLPKVVLQNMIP